MAVILPSLSSLKSGSGCSLALILPPTITAPRVSTKMPTPLTSFPIIPPPDLAGTAAGFTSASSAMARFLRGEDRNGKAEQVLCHVPKLRKAVLHHGLAYQARNGTSAG